MSVLAMRAICTETELVIEALVLLELVLVKLVVPCRLSIILLLILIGWLLVNVLFWNILIWSVLMLILAFISSFVICYWLVQERQLLLVFRVVAGCLGIHLLLLFELL